RAVAGQEFQVWPDVGVEVAGLVALEGGVARHGVEVFLQLRGADPGQRERELEDLLDVVGSADRRTRRGCTLLGVLVEYGELRDLLVESDHEHEALDVEEQLHRLEYVEGV